MILYHALGGGLGHITRSIAILSALPPEHQRMFRLMVSSDLAGLTARHAPCAFEVVPKAVMASRKDYYYYLNAFIELNMIRAIVIDTFPLGLIHEWADVAANLPRFLIARYLNLNAYNNAGTITSNNKPFPEAALCIEDLEPEYLSMLKSSASLTTLASPIILENAALAVGATAKYAINDPDWIVVNSGSPDELAELVNFAKNRMRISGKERPAPAILSPEHGIYPCDAIIRSYKNVVSAVGYNMAALASLNTAGTHYFLPLIRKYDDQFLRLERLESGNWQSNGTNGAPAAAMWLMNSLGAYL